MWVASWTAGNLWWIATDRLLRDGDEEGHVGAAELFRGDLLGHDPLGFLARLWVGDMGDYPSVYPALTGAWWWLTGAGDPGTPVVRGLGLAWPLLTAAALGALAGRGDRRAGLLAAACATLLPLPVGLARHFMPEGMLVAAVSLAVLAAVRLADQPGPGRALTLGLATGLGLLVKQTFALLAGPAVLAALITGGRRTVRASLLSALVTAIIAGPWYLRHAGEQLRYVERSATSATPASALLHLAWYPAALFLLVAGPPLCVAALGALGALRRAGPARRLVLVGLVWLLGGTLMLTLVPKKYPRLAAPLGPSIALLAGLALTADRRAALPLAGLTAAGAAWLGWHSVVAPPTLPRPLQSVVPGCPQHWLRPPVDDDLGVAAVAAAIAGAPPGPVRILDAPEIPCAVQTTPAWDQHLGPYLRRVGIERDILHGPGPGAAAVTIQWHPDLPGRPATPGDGVIVVPRLGGHFEIRFSPRPSR